MTQTRLSVNITDMRTRHTYEARNQDGRIVSPTYYQMPSARKIAQRVANDTGAPVQVLRDGRVRETINPEG